MTGPGTAIWFFAVVGGTIILALVLAYGLMLTRRRSAAQRRLNEQGAHDIYQKEERQP